MFYHSFITVTVSSWAHPILSSNLSRNQPVQKVQNFAARLILTAPRHHHSTPLLKKLHWLPISECIKYKVACMCFHAVNESGFTYLSELLHIYTLSLTLHSFFDSCMLKMQQDTAHTSPFYSVVMMSKPVQMS